MSTEEPTADAENNASLAQNFLKSFELMNTNITGYMFDRMENMFRKEYNKAAVKDFKTFLKDVSSGINEKVNEKLYSENELIQKLEGLEQQAKNTDENNRPRRIYDDTDETFEALIFKHKKRYLERIAEPEQVLDKIIDNLKTEVSNKYAEFSKKSQLK